MPAAPPCRTHAWHGQLAAAGAVADKGRKAQRGWPRRATPVTAKARQAQRPPQHEEHRLLQPGVGEVAGTCNMQAHTRLVYGGLCSRVYLCGGYVCTCVPVYLCTCVPVWGLRVYLCTCVPVYLCTCVPVYLCTCVGVCVHVRTCVGEECSQVSMYGYEVSAIAICRHARVHVHSCMMRQNGHACVHYYYTLDAVDLLVLRMCHDS